MNTFANINDVLLEASIYSILKELKPERILDIGGTLGRMHCTLPSHIITTKTSEGKTTTTTLDMEYSPEIDALALPDYSFSPDQTDLYGAIYSPAIPPAHAYHMSLLLHSFDFSDDTLLETVLAFAKLHSSIILLETTKSGITKPENMELLLKDWNYQFDLLKSGNRLFSFIHK